MNRRLGRFLLLAVATAIASGCATRATTLNAQWVNPQFAGQKLVRNVLVISAARDTTNRRVFEDQMVAALSASGVKAVQSYKLIPEDGPISELQLRRVVGEAGVSHAMVTRIVNVSTDVTVSPGMVMGPAWGPGWGGSAWGPGWGGAAGYRNSMYMSSIPPQVTTTQNVHADTRVFEAGSAAVIWSAATTTAAASTSVPQLIAQFVELIVATMTKDGVI